MRARFAFFGAAVLAAALAACGGGGGGGNPPPTSPPTATPTAPPSGSPAQNVTLGTTPTSAPFPSGAGISGSVALPGGSGSATLSVGATPPAGTVAIQLRRRAATTGNTAVAYVSFTATSAVTMNGIPGFTATLPSSAPTGTYWEAFDDDPSLASPAPQAAAWVSTTTTGQAGAPGVQVTFSALTTPTITLAAGQSLYLAVYIGNYIPPINSNGCVGVQTRPHAYVGTPQLSHPINPGDSYSYSGTLTQTIVRSQPCPQPTATANANVSVAVSVASSGGNTTETSVESDAYPTNTTSVTTVANVALQSASGINKFFENSETATDGNGNTVATTFGTPLQFAQTPEMQGNTWSNVLPTAVNQTLADGSTLNRTNASNGTYTEIDTIPGGGTNTITVNADGSGSYDIGKGTGLEILSDVMAPANGTISATTTVTSGGSSSSSTIVIPSWLPSPLALYSDLTNDLGTVASLPSACSPPVNPLPTTEHLQRQISAVDPALGTLETETIDSYDFDGPNGWYGPACSIISDTLNQYYDFSIASTPYLVYHSHNGQPLQANTISETLSLQPGFVALGGSREASARMQAQLNAHLAGIRFARSMQRAQTIKAASAALRNHFGGHQ